MVYQVVYKKEKPQRTIKPMGYIFYLMGKSSTGKDTIYNRLLEDEELNLKPVVIYTTRPMRQSEVQGVTYYFTDEAGLSELQACGKVIECRGYQTVHGMWYYFTVEDEQFEGEENVLMIGTLESYEKLREHFKDRVIPIFIAVDDKERLLRAIHREEKQNAPSYAEVCRRFLADEKDFSKENIEKNKITHIFENQVLEECVEDIKNFIRNVEI